MTPAAYVVDTGHTAATVDVGRLKGSRGVIPFLKVTGIKNPYSTSVDKPRAGDATIDGEQRRERKLCSYDLVISGNSIYVCNYLKNQIEVVRLKDMVHIGRISDLESPHGITTDGNRLIVAGYRSRKATWLAMNGTRYQEVFHDKWMPVSVARAEGEYYFADYENNRITRMRMGEDKLSDLPLAIGLDQKPHAIKTGDNKGMLVITLRSPGKIILARKGKPLREVVTRDADPLSAVLTPAGIVMTCYKKGTIEIIEDITTDKCRPLYQSDSMPTGLAYYQERLYFCEEESNLLGVLDLKRRKKLA